VKIGKTTVDFGRMIRQEKCEPVSSGVTYAIYDANQIYIRIFIKLVSLRSKKIDKENTV